MGKVLTNILFVAAENDALPNGKVGGIGDVIRDVPQFLADENITVDVITPGYLFHSKHPKAQKVSEFTINFAGQSQQVSLFKIELPSNAYCKGEVNQWVLEHPIFANGGEGNIYFDDGPNRPFASDATKFAFFSQAVCHLVVNDWRSRVDILHLHDWHAAWIAILREYAPEYSLLKEKRCVYTIHNLSLQGIRPIEGDESSLKHWFPQFDLAQPSVIDPRYSNCVNPTRAAINLCEAIHAVSPTYAQEITEPSNPELGFVGGEGLEQDLTQANNEHRLAGILNGCIYNGYVDKSEQFYPFAHQALAVWSSKHSSLASVHFIAQERLNEWSHQNVDGPILTSIGRITSQKVAILLTEIDGKTVLSHLLSKLETINGRLIILGSGDQGLSQQINEIVSASNAGIFLNGYDATLSDAVFDLGDLFLMPSSFEPCGISQLLAMRAGQPCIVNQIGGLNDTVVDGKTGFCFNGNSPAELGMALIACAERAIACYLNNKAEYAAMVKNARDVRFEWQDVMPKYRRQLYKLHS